jgi:ABC-type proline/glycine betaine transport system permease subunit
MDFMQTMPAFVFMIPVIAFFGTGKPAAVVTTMIFGGTPVVRLTVLGLRGVPDSVREAAISFGANKWYLLTRVDLPLASPSIRAGINQTIMLSLAMVVVASLIGAKGLGEDVLEALQYANVGQGILAGFAILFCAMILDRIVQGAAQVIPLVLVHGFMGGSAQWQGQIAAFSGTCDVIAVDLPGFGANNHLPALRQSALPNAAFVLDH